ncbi:MAG: effector binding domain-containing protein [Rickettsiales bacterium]
MKVVKKLDDLKSQKFITIAIGVVVAIVGCWMLYSTFFMNAIKPHEGFINRPIIVVGNSVESSYDYSMETQKELIEKLWKKFHSNKIASKIPDSVAGNRFYGVYSEYGNGGKYKLTAGTEVASVNRKLEDYSYVTIPVGKYLVFSKKSAKGFRPQLVIDGWKDIDQYFDNNDDYVRDYKVDFEVYYSDGVDIYISYSEK